MVQATDPVIDELLKALHRVIRQSKRAVQDDTVDRAALIILSSLKENSAVRLSDLASDLCLDISTVSRQAKALEDRGLLTRTDDLDDRRAVRLELAPAGRALLDEAWTRRNRWLAASLHDWTPADRAALVALLARFADSMTVQPTKNESKDRPKTETSA